MPVLGTSEESESSELIAKVHAIEHGYRTHYYISTELLDRLRRYLKGNREANPLELVITLEREMRSAHFAEQNRGKGERKVETEAEAAKRTLNQQLWDEMEKRDAELLGKLQGEGYTVDQIQDLSPSQPLPQDYKNFVDAVETHMRQLADPSKSTSTSANIARDLSTEKTQYDILKDAYTEMAKDSRLMPNMAGYLPPEQFHPETEDCCTKSNVEKVETE
jgi:hypothetical protein